MVHAVYLLDDDNSIIAAVTNLLTSAGFTVVSFTSPQAFLALPDYPSPSCLILDLNMPGINGLEVVHALSQRGYTLPAIFLTGFGTIPISVQAMKAGAWEFLTKPVEPDALITAVTDALKVSEEAQAYAAEKRDATQRYHSLTPRELEVMLLAARGLLNKQIAAELGVSEITAKVHKRRVIEKMGVRSVSELARVAERLGLLK
ncbi:DNA-binding response regulator [Candidatus Pantoea deserta]|uniref:DNA-binding response regulator n=1 Tax=Candidatus Pantoea deserta TaxID=1869313 RepID=A0A3N4NJU6_9GAMM|nr:response regulator [Pantoea deserta]RPD94687.1 DNA-binding response regulator [Pantoea deserta]